MKSNTLRGVSFAIIFAVYVFVFIFGLVCFEAAREAMPELWAVLLADVLATVAVWAVGVACRNVSVYDPYWSVAPPLVFTAWAFYKDCFTQPVVLLLVAVWYWGIRLTGNWAYTFRGLAHEDWRYTRYRESQPPLLFQMTNLWGLNMVPTLVVFAAMLPGFALYEGAQAVALTWIGFAVCLMAATIQLVADIQIHRFRREHPGQYCTAGLWRHGRHPNYFGEISMWWGVWLMYAAEGGLDWLVIGPLIVTALFLFVSIPMMERRQLANKPGYADYRRRTRMLI